MKKLILSILIIFVTLSGCTSTTSKSDSMQTKQNNTFMYARTHLNQKQIEDYDQILDALLNHDHKAIIHATDEDEIIKIYNSVLNDHPEIFWVSQFEYQMGVNTEHGSMIIYPTYDYSKQESKAINKKLAIITKQIMKGIDQTASDYEKVNYIFNFVINQTEYVDDAPDSQNIISSLLNKESVCAGYAKAIQYLLLKLEVPCALITGKATSNNISHAWNMVKMDGDYYYLDATFADNEDSQSIPLFRYLYMGMSSDDIAKLYFEISPHEKTKNLRRSYYMMNHCYLDSYNETLLQEIVNQSIQSGQRNILIRFDSLKTMDEVNEKLMKEYQLFDLLEQRGMILENIKYYHVPELNSIIYIY